MLRGFIAWFESYLSRTGVVGLTKGALGILAFGGALSAVVGDSSAKAGAVVAVLAATLGLILLLVASRSEWQRRSQVRDRLLVRYLETLDQDYCGGWRLTRWIEKHVIEGNGDSTVFVTVHAVVTREVLHFYRFQMGAGWNQPVQARKGIAVQVRSLMLDGIGGARCDLTEHWRDDGKLEVWVHFPSPVHRGNEFRIFIETWWPGRSKPLVKDRVPDEFCVVVKPPLEAFEYTIVLPQDEEAFCDPIGFRADNPDFLLVAQSNGSGRQEVRLAGRDVSLAGRVGVRLDLKKKVLP
ncbi:hypothetical protein [Kutzneria buriramensis]|uniref:Uncharacterized protein n=1 Tax=Kutzneria buriramensis TaxID=1045776 RepID=A0A3E0I8V3_9PSEU|nr:hypothetical protein [Kutzneria buriramensis]REH55173.1 hypothetical protein BCF44_101189 [Kutzneria buriramensis]